MRVLVIPDVHLKPWMFLDAEKIIEKEKPDKIVCLMDIPDDWGHEWSIELYKGTFDTAINFAKTHPDSLWCYGNHDVCYLWNQRESGYSRIAPYAVCKSIQELKEALSDENQMTFIHRIDNVLFMHGGLYTCFVEENIPEEKRENIDDVIACINGFGCRELWCDDSPIWARPQMEREDLYMEDTYTQVVGHTPVREIRKDRNVISCDVFSTDSARRPIGTMEYLLIDTETLEFHGISRKK